MDVRMQLSVAGSIRLTAGEAFELSRALWRLGELRGIRGGITLSAALLEARRDGRTVVLADKDAPIVRDALTWLTQTDRLIGNLVSLSRGLQ